MPRPSDQGRYLAHRGALMAWVRLSQPPPADFMQVHKAYAVPLRRVERQEGRAHGSQSGAAFRQEFRRR